MQNTKELLINFREKFWEAFHKPEFKTERYQIIWQSLEETNSWLAGPLFSIYECGHCNYVFEDKLRFETINNSTDFYNWAIEKNHQYGEAVKKNGYSNEAEKYDFHLLLFQVETKSELIGMAKDLLKQAESN